MSDTTVNLLVATEAALGTELKPAGAVTALIDGQAAVIPMSTVRDASGGDAIGTPATDETPLPGATGMIGWLSGIYKRLGGAATEAKQDTGNSALLAIDDKLPTLGQKASEDSLPVVLASDQSALNVKAATGEALTYFTGQAVIPTALTTGLNLFFLRNTSATKKIKIQHIKIMMHHAGAAATTRSLYVIRKFTGVTSTTGPTVVLATPGQTSNPDSISDIKYAPAGGTLTGGIAQGGNVCLFGNVNQPAGPVVSDFDMTAAPLVLELDEAISLITNGAIINGSTVLVSLRWTEE